MIKKYIYMKTNSEECSKENNKIEKKDYSPPKIVFVPLKVEEKLMTCGKEDGNQCVPLKFS